MVVQPKPGDGRTARAGEAGRAAAHDRAGYRLIAATGIHRGDRPYQQDQVLLLPHASVHGCLLGVVADGMGGLSGGRTAADQTILTARQLFERYNPGRDDPTRFLQQLAEEAHVVIRLIAVSSEEEPHSTLAAFLIEATGLCHWVHVGDSRLHHFRDGKLVLRTKDHSYVQSLVERGELTEADAERHPQANILLGCLGTETEPPVTLHATIQLEPGDAVLACSDGLWHYVTPQEMGELLVTASPRVAAARMVDLARMRARGTGDNLSLAVVKLVPLEPAPPPAASHPAAMQPVAVPAVPPKDAPAARAPRKRTGLRKR